jgi:hypothetical protein
VGPTGGARGKKRTRRDGGPPAGSASSACARTRMARRQIGAESRPTGVFQSPSPVSVTTCHSLSPTAVRRLAASWGPTSDVLVFAYGLPRRLVSAVPAVDRREALSHEGAAAELTSAGHDVMTVPPCCWHMVSRLCDALGLPIHPKQICECAQVPSQKVPRGTAAPASSDTLGAASSESRGVRAPHATRSTMGTNAPRTSGHFAARSAPGQPPTQTTAACRQCLHRYPPRSARRGRRRLSERTGAPD